jgi:plasmid maintenance system killer protein
MSFQIGYLKLEEIFKSQRKMSLIIHYQPNNDFDEVRHNNKYNHTIPINGNYNVVNKYG